MALSHMLLLAVVGGTSACFITNCPPGGKRSSEPSPARLCPRCGPAGRGVCYSADVCCTGSMCVLNDALATLSCRAEALHGVACHVPGKRCGTDGRCAIRGYCCGPDGCTKDSSCSGGVPTDQFGSPVDILEYGMSER
uniref:Putative neurohypophysial hormones n=1 Tax=Ixodes ricinus TaxID=34613 RepID=A0A147BFX8_IXORI